MDFDDYFEFLPELLTTLPLYLGMLVGAMIVRWGAKYYRRMHQQYGTSLAACGLSGELVAQRLLAVCGLTAVRVVRRGPRDLYHPWKREIQLSPVNYNNPSMGALVTAAHEVGHAQQFASGALLCRLRQVVWPICWALAGLAVLLTILPFFGFTIVPVEHGCTTFLVIAVATIALQLPIQLPLEYDASRRARKLVQEAGLVTVNEQAGFDKLLIGAWLTYATAELQRWILVLAVGFVLWISPSLWDAVAAEPGAASPDCCAIAEGTVAAGPNAAADGDARYGEVDAYEVEHSASDLETIAFTGSPAASVDPTAGSYAMSELPTSAPLGAFDAFLQPLAILAVMGPLCLLLGRFVKGVEPKQTIRDQAIARSNAGLTLFDQGEFQAALAEFDAALRLEPSLATSHYNRGHTYLMLGSLDDAMRDLDAALRIEPGLVHAITARGDVWLKRGDFDRALAEYDTAHRLAPQNATVLTCRGYAWLMRRTSERALADFDAALQLNPKDALAYAGRGMVWLSRADFERAVTECDHAVALGGQEASIFSTRGRAYLSKDEWDHAIADFTEALERNESDSTVLRDRGLAWFFKSDLDRALADLNESIRLDPADAVTHNNRGATLLKMGDYAAAAADLHQSIRLDPNFANPHKHLAWLQATCPDPAFRDGDHAVAHAKRALELVEWKVTEWFSVLAAAQAEAGNFDEAIHWQERCLANSPTESSTALQQHLELYRSKQPLRAPQRST
jgi:tetratricopeptide (TPR) repeat protein/Zn-dependent membrane protease YugP